MDKIDKGILASIGKKGISTYQVSKDSGYAYTTVSQRLFRLLPTGILEMEEVERGGQTKHMWKKKAKVKKDE